MAADPAVTNASYLLQATGKRRSQMFVAISRAAPSLGWMSRWTLVDAIDLHENFKDPGSLYYEISDGVLKLHHSAPGDKWIVRLTKFSSLPSRERDALCKALRDQIEEQRKVYPLRKKIQAASDKHFRPFLDGIEKVIDTIHKLHSAGAKKDEAILHVSKMMDHFNGFYQELKDQNIDDLSLDSWQPRTMKTAIAIFHYLIGLCDSPAVLDLELPRDVIQIRSAL